MKIIREIIWFIFITATT